MAQDILDFESSEQLSYFTDLGGWYLTPYPHSGSNSLRSAYIGSNGYTACTKTVTIDASGGAVTFWYAVDSKPDFDYLKFFIDNVEQFRYSGSAKPWVKFTAPLTAGQHTLTWTYSKDSSENVGADCGYIDDLVIDGVVTPLTTYADTLRFLADGLYDGEVQLARGELVRQIERKTYSTPKIGQPKQWQGIVPLNPQDVGGTVGLSQPWMKALGLSTNLDSATPPPTTPQVAGTADFNKLIATVKGPNLVITMFSQKIAGIKAISYRDLAFPPVQVMIAEVSAFVKKVYTNVSRLGGSEKSATAFEKVISTTVTRSGASSKVVTATMQTVKSAIARIAIGLKTPTSYEFKIQSQAVRIGLGTKILTSVVRPMIGLADRYKSFMITCGSYVQKVITSVSISRGSSRSPVTFTRKSVSLSSRIAQQFVHVIGVVSHISGSVKRRSSTIRNVITNAYKVTSDAVRAGFGKRNTNTHIRPVSSNRKITILGVKRLTAYIDKIHINVKTVIPPGRKKFLSIIVDINARSVALFMQDKRIEVRQVKECQLGNTIRFSATFRNWDGVAMDPVEVVFRIVSSHQDVLFEQTLTAEDNRKAVGSYFIDYVPTKTGNYIFEWYAIIDGTPAVKRGNFMVKRTLL